MALEYFDFFYGSTYGTEWNQMRLALLTGRKYVALVNNYANREDTISKLEKLSAIDLFDHSIKINLKLIQESISSLSEEKINHYKNFSIPTAWKAYCFDNDDIRDFPQPKNDNNNQKLFGKIMCYLIQIISFF